MKEIILPDQTLAEIEAQYIHDPNIARLVAEVRRARARVVSFDFSSRPGFDYDAPTPVPDPPVELQVGSISKFGGVQFPEEQS